MSDPSDEDIKNDPSASNIPVPTSFHPDLVTKLQLKKSVIDVPEHASAYGS
jgi:hypothetical protein